MNNSYGEQMVNLLQEILNELKNINTQTTANTTINVTTNVKDADEFMKAINEKLRAKSGFEF